MRARHGETRCIRSMEHGVADALAAELGTDGEGEAREELAAHLEFDAPHPEGRTEGIRWRDFAERSWQGRRARRIIEIGAKAGSWINSNDVVRVTDEHVTAVNS